MEDSLRSGPDEADEAGRVRSCNEGNHNYPSMEARNPANNNSIATMSDSEFRESLDALLDIFSEPTTTPSPDSLPTETVFSSAGVMTGRARQGTKAKECSKFASVACHATAPPNHPSIAAQPLEAAAPTAGILAPPKCPSAFMMPPTMLATLDRQPVYPPEQLPTILTRPMLPVASNNMSMAVASVGGVPGRKHAVPNNNFAAGSSASIDDVTIAKRARDSFAISEDESELGKRRADRNAREQHRAQKVTHQIAQLRALLEDSGTSLGKSDKLSTLLSVEQHIRQLQRRTAQLAGENQKLAAALQQTTEHSHSQPVPPEEPTSSGGIGSEATEWIDYKSIFDSCVLPVGIAALDGRLMDCNKQFETLTEYSRAELLPMEQPEHENIPEHATGQQSNTSSLHDPATGIENQKKKEHNMSIFNILQREYR
jgi:PAS domain-containing protein